MIDYQIKVINEDFRVTEIADLNLSGGSFSIFLLYKSGMKTTDAVEQISKMIGKPVFAISYSGLKDEDVVTGQFSSISDVGFQELSFSFENGSSFNLKHLGNSPEK